MTQVTMQTFDASQKSVITTYSGVVVPSSTGTVVVDARDVGSMQVIGFTVTSASSGEMATNGSNATSAAFQAIATAGGGSLSGLTLSGMTQGSVLLAGASGVLSQDNSNFFWDASSTFLKLKGSLLPAPLSNTALQSGGRILSDAIAGGGQFTGRRTNGSAASPTALTSGNTINTFNMQGYDGSAYGVGASINVTSLNGWSVSDHSAVIAFLVTPSGSTTNSEIARFTGTAFGLGNTNPQALLSVGATAATARAYNSFTDASNGEWAYMGDWTTSNVVTYGPDKNGTGTYRPAQYVAGGLVIERHQINGDLRQGTGSAVATNATGGFMTIATCAGTPTGVPANAAAGSAQVIYDTTGHKFWAYDQPAGVWKSVALT